ncbi:hypothetical protein OV450_1379 [Actinobacteria bacterium OV450]|nr:hypothetical protein OV450_1379 [Actinobacteria bacterium OV450]
MPVQLISAQLAEAIAREATGCDLAPLDEGRLFRLLVNAGHGCREIGRWYDGRDAAYVAGRIDLLNLIDLGRNALDEDLVPVNLAVLVARLSEANQQLMLNRWIRGDFADLDHAARYAGAIYEDEQPLMSL